MLLPVGSLSTDAALTSVLCTSFVGGVSGAAHASVVAAGNGYVDLTACGGNINDVFLFICSVTIGATEGAIVAVVLFFL